MKYTGKTRTYVKGEWSAPAPLIEVDGKADHILVHVETMDTIMARAGWEVKKS